MSEKRKLEDDEGRAARDGIEILIDAVSEVGKGVEAHTGQTRRLPLILRPSPLRRDCFLSQHSIVAIIVTSPPP